MSQPPLILGIVGNDIVSDSRVKKIAATAAKAGYRSVIVCYSSDGRRHESRMGDVDVIRVPVTNVIRNRHVRVPQPLRPVDPIEMSARHLGHRSHQKAVKRRLEARMLAEGRTLPLWLRLQALRVAMALRFNGYRVRRRLHVTWDRLVKRFNLMRTRAFSRLVQPFTNPVAAILDYEVAFGPEIDELQPDLIHAHEHHMIGIAVTAARRLRSAGVNTRVLYDAHEWVEGLSYPKRTIEGWLREEGRYIHEVDAVTGVSEEQVAQIQERYGLQTTPRVVLNAPIPTHSGATSRSIRDDTAGDGRILVYHGNIAAERGVFTLVDSLSHLPDTFHVAIICPEGHPLRDDLSVRARKLGAGNRLHLLEFIDPDQLAGYLGEADLAVIPYLLTGNNDIALPNKLFESIQAGLPILASDVRSLSRFVSQHGIGTIFRQGDPEDLARAAMAMLDDVAAYREKLTPALKKLASWDAQAETLVSAYEELLGPVRDGLAHITAEDIIEPERYAGWEDYRPTRLAIGPRNMAGQAYAIARAVETHLGVPAVSFFSGSSSFQFPVDQVVTSQAWRDPEWQTHQRRLLSSTFTHVLAESGTGMLGALNGGFIDEQIGILREDRLEVGVILHGSEIRDPRRHRHLPFSPYATDHRLVKELERATERLRAHLADLDVPFFVTTPDLIEDVEATWLPVVIDVGHWSGLAPAFESEIPTVLHMPTNGLLKGSDHIDPVLHKLAGEGMIRYLRPTELIDSDAMYRIIEEADIVIDGIVLGAYGVMSCQAMAAGRIAVAGTRDIGALAQESPIVDANPATLEETLRDLLTERSEWQTIAEKGRRFVSTYHDGSFTAQQLAPFLGIDT